MSARRALPAEEEQAVLEDTMELSAIRRGVEWNFDVDPRIPRRALADQVSGMDLSPSTLSTTTEVHPEPTPALTAVEEQRSVIEADSAPRRSWLSLDHLRRRPLVPVILAGGIGLALLVGLVPGNTVETTRLVPLATQTSLVCPSADGTLQVVTSDDVSHTATELGEPAFATQITSAEGGIAGGTLIADSSRATWVGCSRGLADQYVQLPGGKGAQLQITNPDSQAALIDVTLTGPDGEITGPGLRGVTIEAGTQWTLNIADLADTDTAIGARIRSSVGRVIASGRVDREKLLGAVSATQQGTRIVLPATPGDVTTRLLLSNPGTTRNVVTVRAAGAAGEFDLGSSARITLNAQRTVVVDIPTDKQTVAFTLEGRDPFAATAMTVTAEDADFLVGTPAAAVASSHQQLLAALPAAGEVLVTNNGDGDALATINWGAGQAESSVTIGGESVTTVPIPQGASQLLLKSTLPVTASISLRGGVPGIATYAASQVPKKTAAMPLEYEPGLGR